MAKKKKKMTPAQAAAARRDDKPRKYEPPMGSEADPKDRNKIYTIIVPLAVIVAIVLFSSIFAFFPPSGA